MMLLSATDKIKQKCLENDSFKYNIELLDLYDLNEFLTEGRSLWNIWDAIENKYDLEFWNKYQTYALETLSGEDLCDYLASRYNIRFQPYTDWVVRKKPEGE